MQHRQSTLAASQADPCCGHIHGGRLHGLGQPIEQDRVGTQWLAQQGCGSECFRAVWMVVGEFQQHRFSPASLVATSPQQAAADREGLLRSKGSALQAELRSLAIPELGQSAGQL